jgi:Ca2+-binding EF-hand superfamily protein
MLMKKFREIDDDNSGCISMDELRKAGDTVDLPKINGRPWQ